MPAELNRLRAMIDAELADQLSGIVARLGAYDTPLDPLSGALTTFVAGGKRIRPIGLLLGHRAAGATADETALGPALALELLHTCALLHDDVIDRAETRRGQPTVHHAFADAHRKAQWHGDADGYGEAVAILLGDLAFVYADELFFQSAAPADATLAAFRRFTAMREEVMAGQYLDLHAALSGASDLATAERIATLKSGRYSVSRPLQIGAVLAEADADLIDGLGAFGDPVGRAFQVRDDLLGMFGDETTTGKSASSDLAEGKRTLLVATALQRLDDSGREKLLSILGSPIVTASDADNARELLESSGAKRAAETYITDAIARADATLDRLAIPGDIAEQLRTYAQILAIRST